MLLVMTNEACAWQWHRLNDLLTHLRWMSLLGNQTIWPFRILSVVVFFLKSAWVCPWF
jgi:hypothetical protein